MVIGAVAVVSWPKLKKRLAPSVGGVGETCGVLYGLMAHRIVAHADALQAAAAQRRRDPGTINVTPAVAAKRVLVCRERLAIPQAAVSESIRTTVVKRLYIVGGWISLGAGAMGIFVPLLPSVPLVLLAAYCFSRGSEPLHRWLREQRTFGPMIRNWQDHGVIRPRVKWTTTLLAVPLLGYPVVFAPLPLGMRLVMATVGLGVLGFIWSRPSRPAAGQLPRLAASSVP